MAVEMWNIKMDLCRCCLSEGNFKNLSEPATFLGQTEIYSEMLKDCFSINIQPVLGRICTSTFTICDQCIIRVRDAQNFKKQVLSSQNKFASMYGRYMEQYAELDEASDIEIEIKAEIPESYQDDEDDYNEEDFDESMQFQQDSDEASTTPSNSKKIKVKKVSKVKAAPKTEDKDEDPDMKKKRAIFLSKKFYTLEEPPDALPIYTCVTCPRTFSRRDLVYQHYKQVHLRERPKLIACYLCDVKVPAHVRAFHLEKVHGKPAPTCGACGKKFAYPNQVVRHQKEYHMNEKTIECELCPMKFYQKASLTRHMLSHSDVRPFQCGYCAKAFKTKKSLKTHLYMHLDIRKYVCNVCGDKFVQHTSLKYHLMKKHPNDL